MANPSYTTPNLLVEPGFLYYAPIGTTEPTGTVVGSVFTDTWPVAWVPLGLTDAGHTFTPSLTVAEIVSAELIDPIQIRTTGRSTAIAFMLMNFTATNLQRALNGASSTVTGTTTTTFTKLEPPAPGQEVRCMLGWESLDNTVRWIARQVINSGALGMTLAKSPAHASLPFAAQLEKPAGAVQPFGWQFAGANRA